MRPVIVVRGTVVHTEEPGRRALYTIGHSNHTVEHFVGLLRAAGIEVLVDVRSVPHSAYTPQFDREALKVAIEAAGLRYVWRGAELGGRPDGDAYYDADGKVDYGRMAGSRRFVEAVERLERGLPGRRVVVMCSEEDPTGCHRRLLIGRVLTERGVQVLHLRGDGREQPEDLLREAESGGDRGQQALFGFEEVTEWKSTRSVSRRRPPSSSSGR